MLRLQSQVYETGSELTEAREEAEVLRIRLEAAEQEVVAARQAAAAAQAAAALAHTNSPCPSPQRPCALPAPIPVRFLAPNVLSMRFNFNLNLKCLVLHMLHKVSLLPYVPTFVDLLV